MAAVRHVLRTNTWEMACPICGRMVPLTRAIFTGQQPFRAHARWRVSWSQQLFDRYGMARALRDRAWGVVRVLVRAEARLRAVTDRWEPACPYRETVAWHQDQWPASGIDSFGPTA